MSGFRIESQSGDAGEESAMSKNEIDYDVCCNQCGWTGFLTDLALCTELSEISCDPVEFFKGCPNCKSDEALMDG